MTVEKVIYDLFAKPDREAVKPGGFDPFYTVTDGSSWCGISGHFYSGEMFSAYVKEDYLDADYQKLLELVGHRISLASMEVKGQTASGQTKVKIKIRDITDLGLDGEDEAASREAHPAGSNRTAVGSSKASGGAEDGATDHDDTPEPPVANLSAAPAPRRSTPSVDSTDAKITRAVAYKGLIEMSESLSDPDARRTWVHSLLDEETAFLMGGAS